MRAAPRAASVWLSEAAQAASPQRCSGVHLAVLMPGTAAAPVRIERMVQKADFERMLAVPSRQRSAHFAVHHLPERPALRAVPARLARKTALNSRAVSELSTDDAPACTQPVDDSSGPGQWLGTVIPKRHAKRATTRNLVRRQIHQQFQVHSRHLPAGLWVVRLKAPFAPQHFVSARSDALASALRLELAGLLRRAAESHGC